MRQPLTQEEVTKRLEKVSPDIKILGQYKNAISPLKCKCLICKHIWYPVGNSVSRGYGCPKCASAKSANLRTLTHDEIKKRLRKISPTIKVIGKYKGALLPLKCKCLTCSHVWGPTWGLLSRGVGCPECNYRAKRLTQNEIKKRLRKINPTIKILGRYRHSSAPLKCKCLVCKTEWLSRWDYLSQGCGGCPKCGVTTKLTIEEVKRRLKKLNPKIKIVGKIYESAHAPSLRCKCLKCKGIWYTSWHNLYKRSGCPRCCTSKSENEARRILERLTGWKFPKAPPNVTPWLNGLHLDGYNKRHSLAFEYQGEQHKTAIKHWRKSREFKEQRLRDERKRIACYRRGVRLIIIPCRKKKSLEMFIKQKLSRLGII